MDQDRRAFLTDAGTLLVLTGAAAIAWDHVARRAPRRRPRTTRSPITGGG